jgi:hypothetical protein
MEEIYKVTVNVLKKQSQKTDKGCLSSWGLGVGLILLAVKANMVFAVGKAAV